MLTFTYSLKNFGVAKASTNNNQNRGDRMGGPVVVIGHFKLYLGWNKINCFEPTGINCATAAGR